MGMEHLGKEKNDVLGRVNSMCVDSEVKERVWHIRITERNPEGRTPSPQPCPHTSKKQNDPKMGIGKTLDKL